MKKYTFLLVLLVPFWAFSQNLPFPQHYTYTTSSIKPSNHTQAQLDSVVKSFYNLWKPRYFRNSCNPNQYYVWFGDEDPTINSVSEGQGYGMMIAAYMAGYDASAKTIYDGLYNYYKAHKDSISFELMAWEQNTSCVDTGGADDATDGDLDIAYSLLLADKQWGSAGAINYLQEAKNLIDSLMVYVIDPKYYSTELGDWITPSDTLVASDQSNPNATRPSDFMPDHFRAFENATGDSRWTNVLNECYKVINTIQTNNSPTTGLICDFVLSTNKTPVPAPANFLEGPYDGDYYYNACRVPWRLTTDFLISGEPRASTAVNKIDTWLKGYASNNPANINSGWYLNGSNLPGNNYPDPSFIGPFAVGAMTSSANQTWLNGVYDYLVAQSFDSNTYFPNTLKMLNLIVISGNYWPPYTITGIENTTVNNIEFTVYPNPAKGSASVSFTTNKNENVTIDLKNIMGQEVQQITNGIMNSGEHKVLLNTSALANGVYFVTITTNNFTSTQKLVVGK